MESENLFCHNCGMQLQAIDEIEIGLCNSCNIAIREKTKDKDFLCWACAKEIATKKEIAQGVCNNCKAHIIRKLRYLKRNSI